VSNIQIKQVPNIFVQIFRSDHLAKSVVTKWQTVAFKLGCGYCYLLTLVFNLPLLFRYLFSAAAYWLFSGH